MAKTPKRANLKPPGRCIFCDSLGVTQEHMWADWLRSYIPRTLAETRTRSALIHLDGDKTTFINRTGDPHSRRIKCVCRKCNNEWMSRLQEDSKPFLVPMLTGEEQVTLHRRAQTILSAWIAMTVMVAEHADKEKIAISSAE
jgi:hypothetical protein